MGRTDESRGKRGPERDESRLKGRSEIIMGKVLRPTTDRGTQGRRVHDRKKDPIGSRIGTAHMLEAVFVPILRLCQRSAENQRPT